MQKRLIRISVVISSQLPQTHFSLSGVHAEIVQEDLKLAQCFLVFRFRRFFAVCVPGSGPIDLGQTYRQTDTGRERLSL